MSHTAFFHLTAAAAVIASAVTSTAWAAPSEKGELAPHRAVYDLRLHEASDRSGIAAVDGRIVFDIKGSRCDGYTSNFRLVMRVFDTKGGAQLTDLQTSTHESPDGFNFAVRTFANGVETEDTLGYARHDGNTVTVDLKRPQKETLSLPGDALFPVEHTKAIIATARAGGHLLETRTFDGSESGRAVFPTLAVIGDPIEGRAGDTAKAQPGERGQDHADAVMRIGEGPAWPVTVSYYDADARMAESEPAYEISFIQYANGVTRRLRLDYGEFSVDGGLSDITYVAPAAPCP